MSDQNYNPIFKQPIPSLNPVKSDVPAELKALDGVAIGAVKPEDNSVGGGVTFPASPLTEEQRKTALEDTEFHLHPDGTLAKFTTRPDGKPGVSVVDGAGQIFCIARNDKVADLICNGINYVHLAAIKAFQGERVAEGDKLQAQGQIITPDVTSPSGIIVPAPPLIITPRPDRN